jgi:hypothetical protein
LLYHVGLRLADPPPQHLAIPAQSCY